MSQTRRIIGIALTLGLAVAAVLALRRFLDREVGAAGPELAPPEPEAASRERINGAVSQNAEPTRDQLYTEARRLEIQGRSKMNKQELQQAVEAAKTGGPA
jgi:hypothetical protein